MKRPVYISEDMPLLTKIKVRQFPKRRVVGGWGAWGVKHALNFSCGMKVQLNGGGGGILTRERSCSHAHLVFCFSCC